jgi:hypothetical protein
MMISVLFGRERIQDSTQKQNMLKNTFQSIDGREDCYGWKEEYVCQEIKG